MCKIQTFSFNVDFSFSCDIHWFLYFFFSTSRFFLLNALFWFTWGDFLYIALTSASLEGLWLTSALLSGANCCTRLRLVVSARVSLANFVHPASRQKRRMYTKRRTMLSVADALVIAPVGIWWKRFENTLLIYNLIDLTICEIYYWLLAISKCC